MKQKLRLVSDIPDRPLAPLSRAEKLARAKAYLQRRGIYILDKGTRRPNWGVPGEPPRVQVTGTYQGLPTILERFSERLKNAWRVA